MAQITNNPLVSVIVITYNSSKFVLETLESIKAQTYQNIELVISDDSSNDDTVLLCKNWIEENKDRFVSITVVESPVNTGIPANCNRGVNSANGEWIKLIAGDDALMPNCIKDNVEFISDNKNIKIAFSCSLRYLNQFDDQFFIGKYPFSTESRFYLEETDHYEQYKLLIRGNIVNAPTVFMFKKTIEEVGLFDERFKYLEDYPLWLKLTKAGFQFYFLNKVTVRHRYHDNATDSKMIDTLYKNSYYNSLDFFKIYIFPNLAIPEMLSNYYNLYIRKTLRLLGLNKRSLLCRIIDLVLTKYFSPFAYIEYIYRKLLIFKAFPKHQL